MSNLPTLFTKGSVKHQQWMDSNVIDKITPIEFLVDYFNDKYNSAKEGTVNKYGDKLTFLLSGTGTGKSTVLPPALFDKFFTDLNIRKNIICSQPTIVSAISIPTQIIEYNKNLIFGENIGYQTGNLIRKPPKGLNYVTTGVLLQIIKSLDDEDIMRKYSFIIVDEIHIRSLEMDSLLFYIKSFLLRCYKDEECPQFILMSATFDPKLYMDYFNSSKNNFIEILGSSFPIVENYAKFDVDDAYQYIYNIIEKLHTDNKSDYLNNEFFRDVLVFMPSTSAIEKLCVKLHNYNFINIRDKDKCIAVISILSDDIKNNKIGYKMLTSEISQLKYPIYIDGDNTKAVKSYKQPKRKVIICTNAMETGITIDSLKYCIDSGMVFSSQFQPQYGVNAILAKNINLQSFYQRRGRLGRKAPGIYYSAFTEKVKDQLDKIVYSDIITQDISSILLGIIINTTSTTLEISNDTVNSFQLSKFNQRFYKLNRKKEFDVDDITLMQLPSVDGINYSIVKLQTLGFIDLNLRVTPTGYFCNKLRKLPLESIRMIFAGYNTGAHILTLVTIAAFANSGVKLWISLNNKYKPNIIDLTEKLNESFNLHIIADDFINSVFIWEEFIEYNNKLRKLSEIKNWLVERNINYNEFINIIALRDEIISDIILSGLNLHYNSLQLPRSLYNLSDIIKKDLNDGLKEIMKIKRAIYDGYIMNLCFWDDVKSTYVHKFSKQKVLIRSQVISPLIFNESINKIRPKNLIVNNITLLLKDINLYEFKASFVSVMDGFVNIDNNLF